MLDELASGVPSAGAPDIERAFRLSHAATTATLFVVPGIAGLLLDPLVFALADRYGRPRMIRLGLAAKAVAAFGAALSLGPISLGAALALWFVAAGAATGLTEATLLDAWPERQARTMARWTLLSLVGDFAGPMLVSGLAWALGERGWRTGFAVVGAIAAAWAIALSLRAFPVAAPSPDDDEPTLWQAARDALRDRVLMAWLLGTALCDLLDEILVVFASLRVRAAGAGAPEQGAMITAFVAGGAVGLVVLDRLLARSRSERRLLVAFGLASAVSFAAWLATSSVTAMIVAMVPVGATAAPLYPLASAQAYARRPGRAGVVMIASHLFAPLTLALPWLLGLVADRAGVLAALAVLVAQPLGLVALAVLSSATPPPPRAQTTAADLRDDRAS